MELDGFKRLRKIPKKVLKTLRCWVKEVLESQYKEMLKVVSMIHRQLENILAYFDSYITDVVSEGLNSKIQSLKANARGLRSFKDNRMRIHFFCGKLKLSPQD